MPHRNKASANDACWMFLREWRREAQGVARSPGVSQAPKSLPCSTRASQIRYAADRAREEARKKTILGQINDVCHADRGAGFRGARRIELPLGAQQQYRTEQSQV